MAFNLDDYEPVEDRLRAFYGDWPGGRVVTVLLEPRAEGQYIVRAEVFRSEDGLPSASGLAEETTGSSPVNRTSALENCETSAIGRALANLNYAAKKRPSREEMSKTVPATGPTVLAPAGVVTTEAGPSLPPQAGASTSAQGEGAATDAAGTGSDPPSRDGSTTTVPAASDQPGPPHYALDPSACDHKRTTGSHGLLSPRKSPRGPVCPRCGLSYITVTEGTTAVLGAA